MHSEILKKIVTEPYQQQFINIVSGVPIFEKNKDVIIVIIIKKKKKKKKKKNPIYNC